MIVKTYRCRGCRKRINVSVLYVRLYVRCSRCGTVSSVPRNCVLACGPGYAAEAAARRGATAHGLDFSPAMR